MYKNFQKAIICAIFACSFLNPPAVKAGDIETAIELLPENRVDTGNFQINENLLPKRAGAAKNEIPYVKTQPDFEITQEDIDKAIATPAEVTLSKKYEHDIRVMETRHFEKVNDYDSPKYRIIKLEKYLLGRTWEFSPVSDRMERLRLASQRKMLSGTSLPVGIRQFVSPARIANDSTPIYEDDSNVGLIDGFLRLYAPEVYKNWSARKKRIQERYNDG